MDAALAAKQRVEKAVEALRVGLGPYVGKHMRDRHGNHWRHYASRARGDESAGSSTSTPSSRRCSTTGTICSGTTRLRRARSFISLAMDARNRAAHYTGEMSAREALRYLDALREVAAAVGAAPQAGIIEKLYDEQTAAGTPAESEAPGLGLEEPPAPEHLRPWRDVCEPHPDVLEARFSDAEFAANLAHVDQGEGSEEYTDPAAFFRITYATEGLRRVLAAAIARLAGDGRRSGDRAADQFRRRQDPHHARALPSGGRGGGGIPPRKSRRHGADLRGGRRRNPRPGQPRRVRRHPQGRGRGDARRGRPRDPHALGLSRLPAGRLGGGRDHRRFRGGRHQPRLGAADSDPAERRALPDPDGRGGGFRASAARHRIRRLPCLHPVAHRGRAAVDGAVVVGSLPESGAEVGDEQGRDALQRLEKIFGRVQSAWTPASGAETFEIVRRRLFQPLDEAGEKVRDETIRAFPQALPGPPGRLPAGSSRGGLRGCEMRRAYPLHPEVLRRFSGDWSVLEKFQRTRGILKIMANAVYALWSGESSAPLITPALLPFRDAKVRTALLEPLDHAFGPILQSEVDGDQSLTARIESQRPRFSRSKAARQAARAVFFATAPRAGTGGAGMTGTEIRLACAQPGDQIAIFGEALQEIASRSAHLYRDGDSYWFSPQATLNKLAADRARDVTATTPTGASSSFCATNSAAGPASCGSTPRPTTRPISRTGVPRRWSSCRLRRPTTRAAVRARRQPSSPGRSSSAGGAGSGVSATRWCSSPRTHRRSRPRARTPSASAPGNRSSTIPI